MWVPESLPKMKNEWNIDSWKKCNIKQEVQYPDEAEVKKVLDKISRLPPLVAPGEIDKLRTYLAEVALNKRFLLQGGDCAELFEYCSQEPIENKLKVLLQMSLILVWSTKTPIVRIARMAGQYAKPRSSPTETIDGKVYNSFRGDNVNGISLDERTPDPERLLSAYFHSAATINYCRALLASEFADLHNPENWNIQSEYWTLEHVKNVHVRSRYQEIVSQLQTAMDFMRTIGADKKESATTSVDFFISHEGLLLDYESVLTKKVF